VIVIDANVFLASVLKDEMHAAAQEFCQAILSGTTITVVPCLFRYEVANAFCVSLRRKRISQLVYERFITLTANFPMQIDDDQKMGAVSDLACMYGLTIYDAAYIEIAKRRELPLATFDKAMLRCARKENITILF
jgi:predicted nucleic acid-binding protein